MAYYGVLADLSTTNTFTELNIFSGGVKCLVEPVDLNDLVTLNYFNTHPPVIPSHPFTVTSDPNILISLTGSPNTSLLAPTNLEVSWSGILSSVKGGTGQTTYTDGQLLIGSSTSGGLVKSTLTAGPGILITNAPGSITIESSNEGPVVSSVTGTENQVFVNNSFGSPVSGDLVLTLPQNINTTADVQFNSLSLPSSSFFNTLESTTLTASRSFVLPNADSNPIQPRASATANQFLTHIDSTGTQFSAQPSLSSFSGVLSSTQGGTGVNNGGATISIDGIISTAGSLITSGNFTTVGTYPLTLTTTATTSVTLPPSGTLATIGSTIPSIQGTANQILVNGSFTTPVSGSAAVLSLPQNIHSGATPQFFSIIVSNVALVGGSFTHQIASSLLTANRFVTLPDAASNTVQPRASATANQFLTFINNLGVQSSAQPSFSNIAGTVALSQLPTYSTFTVTGSGSDPVMVNFNGSCIARVLQISANITAANADSTFIGVYGTITNPLSGATFSQLKIAGTCTTSGLTNTGIGIHNIPNFAISGSGTYTNVYGAVFSCIAPTTGIQPNISVLITTPQSGLNNFAMVVQGNSGFGTNSTPAHPVSVGGNCAVTSVGSGFRIAEGTNAKSGIAQLVSGSVTVSNTSVTASSRILLTPNSLGGVARPEGVGVTSRTPGSNFVITSKGGGDTSVVYYQIIEPA
jgi:hypothetical protein